MPILNCPGTNSHQELDFDIEATSYAPWRDGVTPNAYRVEIGGRQVPVHLLENTHYLQAKIQPFRAGGYEATCLWVDAQKLIDPPPAERSRGPRVEMDERSVESIESSRRRAKKAVRHRIKDMGGNRLCTLTVRQTPELGCLNPDDWSAAFKRYVRLLHRAGLLSDYVAILEPHKIGLDRILAKEASSNLEDWNIPLHLHFVTRSVWKMPIDLMRKLWKVALTPLGRDGNIDVQFMRSRHGENEVIDRVASYATKYITKGWGTLERFNKKRYWSAGEKLMEKGRVWLRARSIDVAFKEFISMFHISNEHLSELNANKCIFFFPDGSGFWMNVRPSAHSSPPPF